MREGYVIVIPEGDTVRLMGDDKGRPYRSLRAAENAEASRSIWPTKAYVLGIEPWEGVADPTVPP